MAVRAARQARLGGARCGAAWFGRHGLAGRGMARPGEAWQARRSKARLGRARLGKVWQARQGAAGQGAARFGLAGFGLVWQGEAAVVGPVGGTWGSTPQPINHHGGEVFTRRRFFMLKWIFDQAKNTWIAKTEFYQFEIRYNNTSNCYVLDSLPFSTNKVPGDLESLKQLVEDYWAEHLARADLTADGTSIEQILIINKDPFNHDTLLVKHLAKSPCGKLIVENIKNLPISNQKQTIFLIAKDGKIEIRG